MNVFVRLLGRPAIEAGGRRWEPPADRRSALLWYLAHAGGWVAREDLLYLFWPDSEERKGWANLRQLLVAVRAQPFAIGLEVERTRVRWPVVTDVRRWNERAEGSDPLPVATDVWPGPFLDGFRLAGAPEFESWLDLERTAWQDRLRDLALEAAAAAARAGRHDDAAGLLERWLRHAPLDEEALRTWLAAVMRLGHTTLALERFAAFERSLAAEMQLAPERATYDLIAKARATAHAAASAAASATAAPETGPAAGGRAPGRTRRMHPRRVGFVGREHELARLEALFDAEKGAVVSLLGPGGIGKTRLAFEAVATLRPRFRDGAVVVQLSAATTVDEVTPALATALGLDLQPGRDVGDLVAAALAPRRTLVLLDNVEQLEGVADLVTGWRAAAPDVAWLLTSRTRVGVVDEALVELAGLPCPQDAGDPDLTHHAAVDLLVRRARTVGSELDPVRDAAAVVRVCRVTAGMPLALELAAGWLRVMPLDAIADELEAGLELLEAVDGHVDPRHRTMRAVFDASWAALSERERSALVRLAAFHGGFTSTAAAAVADVGRPLLLALRNRSFLSLGAGGRFVQHPLLEAYVRERARGDADGWRRAQQRHAAWFCDLLAQGEAMGQAGRHNEANAFLQVEHPNIEAAWMVALDAGWWDAFKMGGATLGLSYATIGRPERWGELLRVALARIPVDTSAWALTEVHEASLDQFQGRVDRAYARRRHALDVLRAHDDRHALAWGLFLAAESAHALGRDVEADAWLTESAAILLDLGDRHVLGMVLRHRCDLADDVAEFERRHRDVLENLAVTRNADHEIGALSSRARFLASTHGDYALALELADRAIAMERDQAWAPMFLGDHLRMAARIRIATGDLVVAEAQAREARELARAIEGFLPRPVPEAEVLLATIAWLRGEADTAERALPATGGAARTVPGLLLRGVLACERGDLILARGCVDQALAGARAEAVGREGQAGVARTHTTSAMVALALGERAAAVRDLRIALDVTTARRFLPTLLHACAVAVEVLPEALAEEVAAWVAGHPATEFAVRRRLVVGGRSLVTTAGPGEGAPVSDPSVWAEAIAVVERVRRALDAVTVETERPGPGASGSRAAGDRDVAGRSR